MNPTFRKKSCLRMYYEWLRPIITNTFKCYRNMSFKMNYLCPGKLENINTFKVTVVDVNSCDKSLSWYGDVDNTGCHGNGFISGVAGSPLSQDTSLSLKCLINIFSPGCFPNSGAVRTAARLLLCFLNLSHSSSCLRVVCNTKASNRVFTSSNTAVTISVPIYASLRQHSKIKF